VNDYEQAKQMVQNPYNYHELDVRDANSFIRGYEAAMKPHISKTSKMTFSS